MKKYYLNNIRWSTVILVLIYHVGFMFNGVGVIGGISCAESIAAFDGMAYIVYPWFMVLLFVIAGMSARYSLRKRTIKQFLKERITKLLIPSTLGLLVLHWITGYLNLKMGGALPYVPSFLVYPISAVCGIGPLWFIQTLFLFSCVIALLSKLDRNDRIGKCCERCNIGIVLLLFFPIWGSAQIWNVPVLTMYRLGIYFTSFAIGYYILSQDKIQLAIAGIHVPMLVFTMILAVYYVFHYYGQSYSSSECLQSALTNLYLWAAVLAVLGCGKAWFDRSNSCTEYLTRVSFGIYIVHYPVLTVACYLLIYYFNLPAVWNYIIALFVELTGAFILSEVIRRIPVINCLVLGITKNEKGQKQ